MKVFVNPGHDPNVDSGAVNIDYDVREADVTKQAGALLERGLKRAGHEVMLLQSDDLDAVVAAANDWPADIFVSLHCNASPGRNARGTETLYYSEQGRLLGEAVPVSYTHLTLPTIYSVQISVVAVASKKKKNKAS